MHPPAAANSGPVNIKVQVTVGALYLEFEPALRLLLLRLLAGALQFLSLGRSISITLRAALRALALAWCAGAGLIASLHA